MKTTQELNTNKVQLIANSYQSRIENENGKEYMIVPVVMMVEGVHSGSRGAILHTNEELSAVIDEWNEKPVTVGHPKNTDGQFISANSDGVEQVGVVRNTRFEGKLRAEVWLDTQKLVAVSPLALEYIKEGRALDVSVGIYSTEIAVTGEWNGEEYKAIATNYQPDHLALLPGEEGACSWADGCGIRNNSKTNNKGENNMETNQARLKAILETDIVVNSLQTNKAGFKELISQLQGQLNTLDSPSSNTYHYLEEIYDESFVYEKYGGGQPSEYYRQSYLSKSDGTIEITGEPIKVTKQINYINVNKLKKEKLQMQTVCESVVDALIANERSKFTEDDKPWLLAQSAEIVEKLQPAMTRKETVEVEVPAKVTDEVVQSYLKDKNLEDVVKLLPDSIQANVQSGLDLRKEVRTNTIKAIMANSTDVWTEDELNAMECQVLSKIAKSLKVEESDLADYSGQGGNQQQKTVVEVEALIPIIE